MFDLGSKRNTCCGEVEVKRLDRGRKRDGLAGGLSYEKTQQKNPAKAKAASSGREAIATKRERERSEYIYVGREHKLFIKGKGWTMI